MIGFYKKTCILVLILLFNLFKTSFSQENSLLGFSVYPKNPSPGQEVAIELNSYYLNLDLLKVSWYVDGNLKKEGVGEINTKVKAGNIGQTREVKIVVTNKDSSKIENIIKIKPITISLINEPQSHIPPFYKGKPLLPYEGETNISVITEISDTNGKKISEDNMIFKWFENSILKQGGVGKKTFKAINKIPVEGTQITLKIYSLDNVLLAETSKILSYVLPKINIYENSPIYGILYNKTIPIDYSLGEKEEIKIVSEPFFFDKQIEDIKYIWKINKNIIEEQQKNNELVLKKTEGINKGLADITIEANNQNKIYQSAKKNIKIGYEQE